MDSSVFRPRRFSLPHRDSQRLPIQQLQPPAVRATQQPPPPPRGPRPEPQSRRCLGAALAVLSTGAALPSYAARSRMLATTASCISAAERGRPAPGSQRAQGDPALKYPHNSSLGIVNSAVHGLRSPCASCNAPDRGSKYFRHLHCARAGMHCAQKKRAVCCRPGRSEARGLRGGFS